MTPQEAIQFLKETIAGCHILRDRQLKAVCEVSINALEKQIPKKPNKKGYPIDSDIDPLIYGYCPCCNTHMNSSKPYCDKCGQAVDWSDTK